MHHFERSFKVMRSATRGECNYISILCSVQQANNSVNIKIIIIITIVIVISADV